MFHIIASTGRTATTYISYILNQLDGVAACHEGYLGSDKAIEPILPLINIENHLCYKSSDMAKKVVLEKRNSQTISDALAATSCDVLIDTAYYNPTIMRALLEEHPTLCVLGIIRSCEDFVRSSVSLTGEDLLPVGWPAPDKELTGREKFISLGRIKPFRGSDAKVAWKSWGSIERNIWLWRETNTLILKCKLDYPSRVSVLRFDQIKQDSERFWAEVLGRFNLSPSKKIEEYLHQGTQYRNKKTVGYQIPGSSKWTTNQRRLLHEAVVSIDTILEKI